jgi:hypothetical protein
MTKTFGIVLNCLLGLLMATACNSAGEAAAFTPVPSPIKLVGEEKKSLPTPIAHSQMIIYDDLQVMMKEAEITTSYTTEYGSEREPTSADEKFVWIHLLLNNIGPDERTLPEIEHFSVLFGTDEFKPTYGHRKDHTDYASLNTGMVHGQEVDAWLRFDIPANAELRDLWFVFLPESSQVSLGFSSGDYFWADHPIYLWSCMP